MPLKKTRSKRGGNSRAAKKSSLPEAAIFEKLLKQAEGVQHYQLRLYITGTTARSSLAIANIRALCEEFLAGNYDLEVIDIYQQPTAAVKEQIIAAPTLIKQFPAPPRRLIGDLSNRDRVLVGLNLRGKKSPPSAEDTKWVKL